MGFLDFWALLLLWKRGAKLEGDREELGEYIAECQVIRELGNFWGRHPPIETAPTKLLGSK